MDRFSGKDSCTSRRKQGPVIASDSHGSLKMYDKILGFICQKQAENQDYNKHLCKDAFLTGKRQSIRVNLEIWRYVEKLKET